MILVTTPTGNTGKYVLTQLLLSNNSSGIRVLVRDPNKLPLNQREKCDVIVGDLRDPISLSKALNGGGSGVVVDTVFYCVPQSSTPENVREYYRSFYEPFVEALKQCSSVKRVITISGGRGNPDDHGPSGPLADLEKAIDSLPKLSTRHIRCGLFMEGIFYWIPQLKFTGTFSLPIADTSYPIAMVACRDIAATVVRLIQDDGWSGQQGVPVDYYQSLSPGEIATVLSRVLQVSISFKQVSGEEFKANLIKYGVSSAMAQALKEMYEDIENGSLNGKHLCRGSSNGLTLEEWATLNLKPRMTWIAVLWSLIFGQ